MSSNHRFDYLRKVVGTDIEDDLFDGHDDRIDLCIRAILSVPHEHPITEVRELPVDLGGLGIPTLSGIDSCRHRLVTRRRVQDFLMLHYPSLLPALQAQFRFEGEQDQDYMWELNHAISDLDAGERSYASVAKSAAAEMLRARAASFLLGLNSTEEGKPYAALFLSASSRNTGHWLRASSLPIYGTGIPFPRAHFVEALRQRLLVPFAAFSIHQEATCTCALQTDVRQVPMHPLVCTLSRGAINDRHSRVRDLLAKFLRNMLPQGNIYREPTHHQGVRLNRRPARSPPPRSLGTIL
jgi:hypothetical protein